jgi:hypothetical protein
MQGDIADNVKWCEISKQTMERQRKNRKGIK